MIVNIFSNKNIKLDQIDVKKIKSHLKGNFIN
jgi:hypothetical protein